MGLILEPSHFLHHSQKGESDGMYDYCGVASPTSARAWSKYDCPLQHCPPQHRELCAQFAPNCAHISFGKCPFEREAHIYIYIFNPNIMPSLVGSFAFGK